ncbi:hypothetical protein BDB00DRAFT_798861 [Zychaea mexicana]|uniref:uncharacterized protein n=1 Tax=Zychaea mexicana TaxID=64656 RepID=UPI0022FE2A94|nr:uncharacterized protein BDB00DRAFT_798861 [Zychaea mexicana]KAI9498641.1 hypothetical protein BDB00DRAFT_798861 [Zychaea mexicana]
MEAAPPPTVEECCEWVSDNVTALETDDDVAIELDSLSILVNALDAPLAVITRLQERIQDLKTTQTTTLLKDVIKSAQEICNECRKCITAAPSYVSSCFIDFTLESPKILPATYPTNYASMWPDQMDPRAYWFRQYFVGKPYITLIGRDTETLMSVLISVVRERVESKLRYRIISRGKQIHSLRNVVMETVAKETESSLEVHGQGYLLDANCQRSDQQQQQRRAAAATAGGGSSSVSAASQIQQPRRRPLRSISSAIIHSNNNNNSSGGSNSNNNQHATTTIQNSETRLFRAAVLSMYPYMDLRLFRELSAEATILSGLEKDILRFDEMEIPKFYKFGVLSVRDGQASEEEWFANSNLSEPLERFLNIIGTPVELEGYKGYTAGLDTKSGESGKFSFAASWRDYEVMFHVAPLMPCRENDKQQVHRKRYIGNDIVCIVFVEGDECHFDPDAIRSQFLHVYVVVHPEVVDGKEAWRIQVINKKNVSECSPLLPSPSLIFDQDELRGFLMLKMINAENAALKCDSFAIPNSKARAGVLKALTETGLKFTDTTTPSRHPLHHHHSHQYHNHNHYRDGSDRIGGERPKSAGAQRISRNSMRSLRAALSDGNNNNHHPRAMTPDAPPVPATSRSSMLRDWKNLTRRRSSGGQSPIDSSSTSSSRGPSPLLTHRPILLDDTEDNNSVEEHPRSSSSNSNSTNTNSNSNSNNNSNSNSNSSGRFVRSASSEQQQQQQQQQQQLASIRSRAQSLVTSVIGRRNSQQQQTLRAATTAAGGLIRSRTFMMDHAGKLIQGDDRHEKL